ncbi:hypothetical protein, partial [uncultured Caulobacter sp.]|uniref:hypothetical protein n=1 Tax=uncultured Caulobacter sp. TaxID=158749 RepID=UPI0026078B90
SGPFRHKPLSNFDDGPERLSLPGNRNRQNLLPTRDFACRAGKRRLTLGDPFEQSFEGNNEKQAGSGQAFSANEPR